MKRRSLLRRGAALAALTLPHAQAKTYPDRAVKLIVPYAPGGTTDLLARIMAAHLQIELKQAFVIENRPGAGGAVGTAFAARQAADGHALVMMVESSHAVNPNVNARTSYDPMKDFAPISNVADVPNVLVVRPSLPVQNLAELIPLLKAEPGRYSYGSSGNGGLSHLNGEIFQHATGTRLLHVPYKGLGPALSDLIAGQIDMVFDNIPSSAAMLQAGQTRALVVASRSRLMKLLPQVPTYAEAGLPELNTPSWFGLGAPAGTPESILNTLNQVVRVALDTPEVTSAIEKQGATPSPMTRAEFASLVSNDNQRWKARIQAIGFTKL